jgi:hypothetical protein
LLFGDQRVDGVADRGVHGSFASLRARQRDEGAGVLGDELQFGSACVFGEQEAGERGYSVGDAGSLASVPAASDCEATFSVRRA